MSHEGHAGKISRRRFLETGAAFAALPTTEAAAQQPKNPFERHRKLLAPLLSNPEWSVPLDASAENAQTFRTAIATYERYYSGPDGRPLLVAGLERLLENDGAHLTMVLATAKKYKVPKEIVFLALAESHWNQFGENRAKAAGYWQFIPGTAVMLGLQNVPNGTARKHEKYSQAQLIEEKDERLDAAKSTDAAMRYIASLKRFFDRIARNKSFTVTERDAWTFAMWAYNRGPGHVRKTFIAAEGKPLLYPDVLLKQPVPKKAKADVVHRSRRESVHYVPKILAIRNIVAALLEGTLPKTDAPTAKAAPKQQPIRPPKPEASPQPKREEQLKEEELIEGEEEKVELIPYQVRPRDNIIKIATWISPDPDFIQLRVDQIKEYNERTQARFLPNQLNKFEWIRIPAQKIHVRRGDTLHGFAKKYCPGWPLHDGTRHLRMINGLGFGKQLQAGSYVTVPLQNN